MIRSLEKMDKLPKYAQNYIAALKREIERLSCRVAVLNGDQKPSNMDVKSEAERQYKDRLVQALKERAAE